MHTCTVTAAVAFLGKLEDSRMEMDDMGDLCDDLESILMYNVLPFMEQTTGPGKIHIHV
jgi:hypothetical protein